MRYKIWFILLAAWLLVACSKESEQTVTPTPAPSPTPGGQTPDPDKPDPTPQPPVEVDGDPIWLVAATRSSLGSADESHSPIQIFLISGTTETSMTNKREGLFSFDPGTSRWSSTIGLKDVWNSMYGFSPANAAYCDIKPASGTSYHSGAVMTMKNINAASGEDLCVIVGVKHSTTNDAVEPDEGQFTFKKEENNYLTLLLDHVFASIDFKVRIGADYSKRRFVKIKKLELLSDYKLNDVTVTQTPGSTTFDYHKEAVTGSEEKPTGIVYDFTLDTDPQNKEGKALTTTGTTFPGYFAPDEDGTIAKGLSLVCTYDVYIIDNNNKVGTRVRENCTAVNSLKGIFTSLDAPLKRGQKILITLTVEPTYLYQLSDDELDNPSIKITSE